MRQRYLHEDYSSQEGKDLNRAPKSSVLVACINIEVQ